MGSAMAKKPFTHRFFFPVVHLLVVMTVSYLVFKLSRHIESHQLYHILSHVFGLMLFASLGFGTFYVYPAAYFRGATAGEMILASLANPFIWATKEVILLTGIYTLGESIYFYLNPINCLLFSGVAAQMGLCEILCRRKIRKRGETVSVLSLPAVLALVIGVFSVVLIFAWELGVNHFYIFQEGYKAIWGYGTGI
jgi:hypothetical protein